MASRDSVGDIVGALAGAKRDDANVGEPVAAERIFRASGDTRKRAPLTNGSFAPTKSGSFAPTKKRILRA
jgi:hypothetical protein